MNKIEERLSGAINGLKSDVSYKQNTIDLSKSAINNLMDKIAVEEQNIANAEFDIRELEEAIRRTGVLINDLTRI